MDTNNKDTANSLNEIKNLVLQLTQRIDILENSVGQRNNTVVQNNHGLNKQNRSMGQRIGDAIVFRRNTGKTITQTSNYNTPRNHAPNQNQANNNPRSMNPDFGHLVNNISSTIRVCHQVQNWHDVPKGIDKQINTVFNNINLVMANENCKNKLQAIANQTKTELLLSTQEHLNDALSTLRNQRQALNTRDINWAINLAINRITNTNKRINKAQIRRWLNEQGVGINTTQNSNSHPEPDVTEPESIHSEPEPSRSQAGPSNWQQQKRPATTTTPPSSSGISLNNRFNALLDSDETNDHGEDNSGLEPITTQTSPPVTRSPKRPKLSIVTPTHTQTNSQQETYTYNGQNLTQSQQTPSKKQKQKQLTINEMNKFKHVEKNKNAWQISIVKKNTNTVVIADSNLKLYRNIPQDWEIHVFPGAKFHHITNIIKTMPSDTNIKNVIVHVGINHRAEPWEFTIHNLNRLINLTKRKTYATHFVGISIPNTKRPNKEITQMNRINNHLQTTVGTKHYITPLDTKQVCVSPSDTSLIHYNQTTVDKISSLIYNHFLAKNTPPKSKS